MTLGYNSLIDFQAFCNKRWKLIKVVCIKYTDGNCITRTEKLIRSGKGLKGHQMVSNDRKCHKSSNVLIDI